MSNSKKIALVVDDHFEQVEFTSPKEALEKAGFDVDVISDKSEVHGLHHIDPGDAFHVDLPLTEAMPDDLPAFNEAIIERLS